MSTGSGDRTVFVSHAADLGRAEFAWPVTGLAYGGDYSPEQWPEEVWHEDVALMQEAGVNLVSLGVFSWGLIEVADGTFEWGWLDRVMDLLDGAGIGVALATPTAAPPMWLLRAHPEIATVDADGRRTSGGGRLAWAPSSAVFRKYALRMVRAIAERYGDHPALRLWHVGNEIGNENARSYGAETATAWRRWLRDRYGDVGALNEAWGSAFWGHRYGDFEEVEPPRHARTALNPGLLLDFERFSSDALLGHVLAERSVLREVTPHVPVTTNAMVQRSPGVADYARWAEELDLVSNDHYTWASDPGRHAELAFSAARTRGISRGRPWLLIEHAAGAVSWQPVNRARSAGEMRRDSLTHMAHGADGAMFFQWRASTAGSEQFHSGMVPHAGRRSQVFRDVVALGSDLRRLEQVRGSLVDQGSVALLFDHEACAALRSGPRPSDVLDDLDLPLAVYTALVDAGRAVDVLTPGEDLTGYRLVVVPTLFLARPGLAEQLEHAARSGATVLVSYLSGIVDSTNRVIPGGYPGALREILGVWVDEFFPLLPDQRVPLSGGGEARIWTERVAVDDAEVVATLVGGDLAGRPAVTRRRVGAGAVWYLAARPDDDTLRGLLADLVEESGAPPVAAADHGLRLTRRRHEAASYLFVVNPTDAVRAVECTGHELLADRTVGGRVELPPAGVLVVREVCARDPTDLA